MSYQIVKRNLHLNFFNFLALFIPLLSKLSMFRYQSHLLFVRMKKTLCILMSYNIIILYLQNGHSHTNQPVKSELKPGFNDRDLMVEFETGDCYRDTRRIDWLFVYIKLLVIAVVHFMSLGRKDDSHQSSRELPAHSLDVTIVWLKHRQMSTSLFSNPKKTFFQYFHK